MDISQTREAVVKLLSDVRLHAERSKVIFQELGKIAQDPDVKEVLTARAFVADKNLSEIDQCFKLIDERPVTPTGRLYETFVEDFRKEIAQIESPVAKRLFALARTLHLVHLRVAEYVVLIAAADLSGHYGVGVLLESCLADKLAFIERTRRIIRNVREMAMA